MQALRSRLRKLLGRRLECTGRLHRQPLLVRDGTHHDLEGTGVHISFLRILRILRVVRVLRLMRAWRGLYQVVSTFLRALPQLANIVVLIALCMFIFALLGMQLFGGIWSESNGYSLTSCPPVNQSPSSHRCANGLYEKPRFHFDYAGPAMITVFIILTGEWVDEMAPITSAVGPSAGIFFIGVVMLGKFLLLNLLIAVILHEFSGEKDTDLQPRRSHQQRSQQRKTQHAK